ncbi:hypothetical protein AtubIFM57258_000648 [Aspergillus tubingensis]|nr:hypothetical protein AtubIFM57258_000648 [Aspergillus tubingensis]
MDSLGMTGNGNMNGQKSGLSESEVIEADRESGYFSRGAGSISPASDRQREEPSEIFVPSEQKAVVTPCMGKNLNLTVQTIGVDEPGPGEVLLRIHYTGICRSDATFSVGPKKGYPSHNHIAGHEGIGEVVKAHDPALLGKLFGLRYLGSSCGSCTYCLRNLPTSCPKQSNAPKQIQGTFQQYARVPLDALVALPETIMNGDIDPAWYASALCSGSTALVSLRAAKLQPGDIAIVVGIAGAIGHLTGMIAKNVLRVKVIGIDLGSKIGDLMSVHHDFADVLLEAPSPHDDQLWSKFHADLLETCVQLRGGHGVDRAAEAVIVTSSELSGFQRLEEYICDGGTIVCAG